MTLHILNCFTCNSRFGDLKTGMVCLLVETDQGLVLVRHGGEVHSIAEDPKKKYFAFMQYSKYVEPEYIRINLLPASPMLASAYKSSDNQEVVLVIINPESISLDVNIMGIV